MLKKGKRKTKVKMVLTKFPDEFRAEVFIGKKRYASVTKAVEYTTYTMEDGRTCVMFDGSGFVVDELKIVEVDDNIKEEKE